MSRPILFAVLSFLCTATPAFAVSWSLGTQFGLASSTSDQGGAGKSSVVAWPASAITYQPGLRVAAGNARHTRDVTLDSGLFLLDEAGSTLSLFTASLAYQHVVMPEWSWSPFGNIGLGTYREDSESRTFSSQKWGAGVGVRHSARDGHGALRVEVRYDYINRDSGSGRPALNIVGLQFGFDLWL